MTVLAFDLHPDRKGAARTERKGSVTEVLNRTYSKRYRVTVDSVLDGPTTIMSALGCPKIGEPYNMGNDSDALATCVHLEIDPSEWPLVWWLTAHYDTERLVDATFSHPLLQPPELSWGGADYTRPMVRDGVGTPVVSSAGNRFESPIEYEDSRGVLTIARNEPGFSEALAAVYRNAVNTDNFRLAAPGYAKIAAMTGVRQYDYGFVYYRVTYEIQFKPDSFAYFVLDQDFRDITNKQFVDPLTGVVLSNPTLLNGRGLARSTATSTLQNGITADTGFIQILAADKTKFPPLGALGFQGIVPPHWYFEVRVDNEVMQVYDSNDALDRSFLVRRGWAGTKPAAHALGATVSLEPYYLRFLPNKLLPFAPLNLPQGG